MKESSKRTLKNVFASLISNEAAIDGAKTAPWWIAIIFLILGTFIPIIPIMVNSSKTYGASFMAKETYGYEQALATVSNKLQIEGYTFTINENHQLEAKKDGVLLENTWEDRDSDDFADDLTPIAYYDAKVNGEDLYYRALNVYYSDRPFSKKNVATVSGLRKEVEKNYYYFGVEETKTGIIARYADATTQEELKDKTNHIPSYLILYKDGMSANIYKYQSSKSYASSYDGSDWKKFDVGTELLAFVNDAPISEGVDASKKLNDSLYVSGVKANWSTVFNKGYKNQKVKTFWFSSGLYYGIYLVLAFFMGLLMWLLTRGKNNPNRNINLWIGIKISMWIDFTPGLLAMIVGFIWSPAAGIAYIALMGIRTMWLSMRQLNPSVQ